MHLRNLFTFNSKAAHSAENPTSFPKSQPQKLCGAITTGFWFCCALVGFDLAINRLFPYPTDPLNTNPKALNLYFDYGRSLEGKVARQIGPTDNSSAPIARAGWLADVPNPEELKQPKQN